MGVASLDGHRLLQTFMYQRQDEQSFSAVLDKTTSNGYTGVLVKALDGENWMQAYDSHPYSLASIQQVQDQAFLAHVRGLLYCVWTVPLFVPDLSTQIAITASLAHVVDAVFLDVEPYEGFWGPYHGPEPARQFVSSIRDAVPDAYLVLQPDPRPERLKEINADAWMEYCDAMAGQHYWREFGTTAEEELFRAEMLQQKYGKPVYPTFSSAPMVELHRAVAGLQPRGLRGRVAWRLGALDRWQLATLGVAPREGGEMDRDKLVAALNELWDIRQGFEAGNAVPELAALSARMFGIIVRIKEATGLQ